MVVPFSASRHPPALRQPRGPGRLAEGLEPHRPCAGADGLRCGRRHALSGGPRQGEDLEGLGAGGEDVGAAHDDVMQGAEASRRKPRATGGTYPARRPTVEPKGA